MNAPASAPAQKPCDSHGILVQCRPGFEPDAGRELEQRALAARLGGKLESRSNSGFVIFRFNTPETRDGVQRKLDLARLVFSRQGFHLVAQLGQLPEKDRLTPLLDAAQQCGTRFSALLPETPDTNEGKERSGFLRRFVPLFEKALGEAGLLQADAPHLPRLHLFFSSATECALGLSQGSEGSSWPMGIPRLRFPKDAPSRSTLKLAEAFIALLTPEEQKSTLRAGLQAVDLGASPGGWTWQLVSRGMRVSCIDNGPMAPQVHATGLIEHLRVDGFTWKPRKTVEWMVCDMIEQPARIAPLMAEWIIGNRCRRSIFNLKLPMKQRHAELERCIGLIDAKMKAVGIKYTLRIKHLYHDREEVTCYLARR